MRNIDMGSEAGGPARRSKGGVASCTRQERAPCASPPHLERKLWGFLATAGADYSTPASHWVTGARNQIYFVFSDNEAYIRVAGYSHFLFSFSLVFYIQRKVLIHCI